MSVLWHHLATAWRAVWTTGLLPWMGRGREDDPTSAGGDPMDSAADPFALHLEGELGDLGCLDDLGSPGGLGGPWWGADEEG